MSQNTTLINRLVQTSKQKTFCIWFYCGCTLSTGTRCFWHRASSATSHTETQYGGQRGTHFYCSTADDRCMSHMAKWVEFVSMDYCHVWTRHITASPSHEVSANGHNKTTQEMAQRSWVIFRGSKCGGEVTAWLLLLLTCFMVGRQKWRS